MQKQNSLRGGIVLKLLMNTIPYRLEQSYELGFGPSLYNLMAEIILAFRGPDQDVLFSYINWDRELDPDRDKNIEFCINGFYSDYIHDPDQVITQKVKEILLQHYAPGLVPNENGSLMDELLSQFRETAFKELNLDLLLKIGSAISDMSSLFTLEDRDKTTQDFVKSRLVFTNSTWLLPYDRPVNLQNLLWYKANTKEDIIQSFELTDWWFKCVILNPDTPVEKYDYFLNYTEEHGDDHDGMVLYISPGITDHFVKNVLPRLQYLLRDKLEIVS